MSGEAEIPRDEPRAAELERLEAEAAGDEFAADRARADQEAAAQSDPTEWPKDPQVELLLRQILGNGFAVLAPAWNVQAAEVDALADAYARSLEDLFPGGAAALGPHFAAVALTAAVFVPRATLPRKLPAKTEKAPEQERAPESDPGPADEFMAHA